MPERAHPDHELWQRRAGVFPTKALRYLARRYRFCRPFVKGRAVLDVPCGTGMGGPYLRHASRLTGLDRDRDAVLFLRERYGSSYSEQMVGDMRDLPFRTGSFDVVCCLEGIEHVSRSDGIRFVAGAARVLRPGGVLVLSCPICVDGTHSGNAFHLYEWSRQELMEVMGRFLRPFRQKVIRGPAGPVLLMAGKADAHMARERAEPERLGPALERAAEWISANWLGERARYTPSSEAHFLPTCIAVLAEETLGTLGTWNAERREQVSAWIKSAQDEETGLFDPELVKPEEVLPSSSCDVRYIRCQLTYFALSALTALGDRPIYPLRFARSFLAPEYSLGWMDAGPWHSPWNHSNRIMFLLRFLIHLARDEQREEAWVSYDAVIEQLLRQQSPDTGLWHGSAGCETHEAVYAAYHFFPFMFSRRILPPHGDKVIDSVLSIQPGDGLFARRQGGGACEDLDAVHVLVSFSLLTNHRATEVRDALLRAFDRILQIQRGDGGFPDRFPHGPKSRRRRIGEFFGLDRLLNKPYRPMSYYSGWRQVGSPMGASDMWGTWFRPLALALIASRYPELGQLPADGRFHSLPALGWHDEKAIRSSLEKRST